MAGRGKPPGDPATTRRRNKPKTPEPLPATAPDAAIAAVPALAKSYKSQRWDQAKGKHITSNVPFLATTRAWYEQWSRSPIARELADVHWLRLADIAILQDRWTRTGDLDVAKELRLQLAAFGGTPADLRRMGKTVEVPPAASPAGKSATVASIAERRAAMRVAK